MPSVSPRALVAAGLLAVWSPGLVACDRSEPPALGPRTPKYAELADADAHFDQKRYGEAIDAYRTFYRAAIGEKGPESEVITYARVRLAEAHYRLIPPSFPRSADDGRQPVLDAFRELKGYVHDYPNAGATPRLRELLSDVLERLMRQEIYLARSYLARDDLEAAALHAGDAIRHFAVKKAEETDLLAARTAEAALLLGEIHLKTKEYGEARQAFELILHDYPTSPLVPQASKHLASIREQRQ